MEENHKTKLVIKNKNVYTLSLLSVIIMVIIETILTMFFFQNSIQFYMNINIISHIVILILYINATINVKEQKIIK